MTNQPNEPKKLRLTPAALGAALKGDTENFLAAATPGGIEAQEKQGQVDQAFAETLPRELRGQDDLFQRAGFVLGEPVDDIFRQAAFPAGWRKKLTDHSMWTEIVDGQGRKRGLIFYKAAFYDRSAHAFLSTRFSLISPARVRREALRYAKDTRAHSFRRVSEEFLVAVEVAALQTLKTRIKQHPSKGVTLQ